MTDYDRGYDDGKRDGQHRGWFQGFGAALLTMLVGLALAWLLP